MHRRLEVTIDNNTWATSSVRFPPSFHTGTITWDIHIPSFLLEIGLLTTPSHASGVSLSEFWAFVRYFNAITNDQDLRLTREFSELDPHQKTILSDDFGMGAPMLWLDNKLNFIQTVDGRYFIDHMAANIGASTPKVSKRGPTKSPDFVALDSSGLWHVIECKGTQSSLNYRERQLGTSGPSSTGAIEQKETITFLPIHRGQRLGCGLYIGAEDGSHNSNLKIVDPPAEESFVVQEEHMAYAEDAINRSFGSRALRLAGFHATSSALSAPWGISPNDRFADYIEDEDRVDIVKYKTNRAREELAGRDQSEKFTISGQDYFGRSVDISLPTPIGINGPLQQKVHLRFGVNVRFLDEMSNLRFMDELQIKHHTVWEEMIGRTKTVSGNTEAQVQMGALFFGIIRLSR